jgi:hypothetical protein
MTTTAFRGIAAALATSALALPAAAQSWDMPTPYGDSVFHTQRTLSVAAWRPWARC